MTSQQHAATRMSRPQTLSSKRKPSRLFTLVVFLTLFLFASIEFLKWKTVDFVLHNCQFEALQNNFLSKHHLLPKTQSSPMAPSRRLTTKTYPVNVFHYSFFDALKREPTQEEYEGLLCQTKAFYHKMFQQKLGDHIYVNLYSTQWTYNQTEEKTVSHKVVVHATLEDGEPLPAEEVNMVVRSSNLAEYIERFVWAAEPRLDGTFFDTSRVSTQVGLTDRKPDEHSFEPMNGIALKSSLHCPANGYYEVEFQFGFFPGFGKKPERSEIEALTPLAADFFTRQLQKTYDTRKVVVNMTLAGGNYDVSNTDMPLTLVYHMLASFVYGGDVIPLEYVKEKLARNDVLKDKIMQQFIQQAVWEVPPFKESTFWDVNRVQMNSKIFRFGYRGDQWPFADSTAEDGSKQAPNDSPMPSRGAGLGLDLLGDGSPNDLSAGGNAAEDRDIPGDNGNDNNAEDGDFPDSNGNDTNGVGDANRGAGGLDYDRENGSPSAAPSMAIPGSAKTSIVTSTLGPVNVDAITCRNYLRFANTNFDRYLSATEYVLFVNFMTNDTYSGYPYSALPDALKAFFDDMALKDENDVEAIDLIGAYRHGISQLDLNLHEETREELICKEFKSAIDKALSKGPVETKKVDASIEFALENQADPNANEGPNMEALDTGFQNLITNTVGPSLQESMSAGIRFRKERKLRTLSSRALALQTMRQLQDSAETSIMPSNAEVKGVYEADCPPGDSETGNTCYDAEAGLDIFLTSDDAAALAPNISSVVESLLEEAIENGDLQREIEKIDPNWKVSATNATDPRSPDATRESNNLILTPAPLRITPAPVTTSATVSEPTTEEDKDKGKGSKSNLAKLAVGSICLMIAIQCAREFLVDLFIRLCKICVKRFRREDDDSSGYDPDFYSEYDKLERDYSDATGSTKGFQSREFDLPGDEEEGKSDEDESEEEDGADENESDEEEERDETSGNGEEHEDESEKERDPDEGVECRDGEEEEEEGRENDNDNRNEDEGNEGEGTKDSDLMPYGGNGEENEGKDEQEQNDDNNEAEAGTALDESGAEQPGTDGGEEGTGEEEEGMETEKGEEAEAASAGVDEPSPSVEDPDEATEQAAVGGSDMEQPSKEQSEHEVQATEDTQQSLEEGDHQATEEAMDSSALDSSDAGAPTGDVDERLLAIKLEMEKWKTRTS